MGWASIKKPVAASPAGAENSDSQQKDVGWVTVSAAAPPPLPTAGAGGPSWPLRGLTSLPVHPQLGTPSLQGCPDPGLLLRTQLLPHSKGSPTLRPGPSPRTAAHPEIEPPHPLWRKRAPLLCAGLVRESLFHSLSAPDHVTAVPWCTCRQPATCWTPRTRPPNACRSPECHHKVPTGPALLLHAGLSLLLYTRGTETAPVFQGVLRLC